MITEDAEAMPPVLESDPEDSHISHHTAFRDILRATARSESQYRSARFLIRFVTRDDDGVFPGSPCFDPEIELIGFGVHLVGVHVPRGPIDLLKLKSYSEVAAGVWV